MDDEKQALTHFLAAQRAAVLAIVAGLDETALTTAVLPSGWTPLGLIEHLGHAERHWFQQILTGAAEPLPWPDEDTPLRTPRPPAAVFAFYRSSARDPTPCSPPPRCRRGRTGGTRTRSATTSPTSAAWRCT